MKVFLVLATLYLMLFSGCAEKSDLVPPPGSNGLPLSNVQLDDLIGIWEAQEAEFTVIGSSPTQRLELVQSGGRVSLEVSSDGRFTIIIRRSNGDAQIITGLFEIDRGVFSVFFDTAPSTPSAWTVLLSANQLSMAGPLDYDFHAQGVPVPVQANLNLIKQ